MKRRNFIALLTTLLPAGIVAKVIKESEHKHSLVWPFKSVSKAELEQMYPVRGHNYFGVSHAERQRMINLSLSGVLEMIPNVYDPVRKKS